MFESYVNGEWLPADKAKIPVADRGFRYGDGVFETLLIRQGKTPFLTRHLKRLTGGLDALKFPALSVDIASLCQEFIERNKCDEGVIRLAISRGVGSKGYLPTPEAIPFIVIELMPLPKKQKEPYKLWLSSYHKPDSTHHPVNFKTAQGLNSTLAILEATENHCNEALLLNNKGECAEASSANLFWRDADGIIHTPSLECGALAGISRKILLEHWKVEVGVYPIEALQNAKSLILCNSIRGAIAVQELNPKGWRWSDASLAEEANQVLHHAI
jgi:branched-subunit amino acid aminotransferase/4-amino-4-deoxychorismate lyase